MLVRELFKGQVSRTPHEVALHFEGRDLTFRELDSLSNRFAQGLMRLGVQKGDKVAILSRNSVENVVTFFAGMKSGFIYIPINTRLLGSNIEFILNHSEASVLIYQNEFEDTIRSIQPSLKFTKRFIKIGAPSSGIELSFEDVLRRGDDVAPDIPLSGEDEVYYLYTAGTTSDPKGVIHTHSSATFIARHWAEVYQMKEGECVLLVLPLFHVYGLLTILLSAITSGAKVVMTRKFDVEETLQLVQEHRVTIFQMVSAMGILIINHPTLDHYDLSSIREVEMGGGFSPIELLRTWRERFPLIRLTNAYGQTESGPCITDYWDRDILEKPTAVGKPSRHVKIRIVDDTGREVPVAQVGEISYKVPSVMKGYYKDPELTDQTLKDGWAHSGDLGFVDEDGYVHIVDRKKDVIIRGGTNISSLEVEQAIYRHPAVFEAAAIGVPHHVLGETVMALVVTKDGYKITEDELKEHCKKYLASFKVPRHVAFLKELPRNPAGKVLKRVLKKQFSDHPE